MGLRLRGEHWYWRQNVNGQRQEVALGIGGGEAGRKKAAAAAKRVSATLREQGAAKRVMDRLGLAPGADPDADVPTFAEWATTYEEVYSVNKAKPKRDAAIIAFWCGIPIGKTTWGELRLDAFTPTHCEAGLNYRRERGTLNPKWKNQRDEVAEGTVQRERGLIQAMFERARKDRLISDNPWADIEKEPAEVRTRLLTVEDETKLKAVLSPQYQRWLEFMLETGLRLDECRKIADADITTSFVHVHGKGRKRRTRCSFCKREGGKCRNVPLTEKARQLLQAQRQAEGKLWGQDQSRLREVVSVGCQRAKIGHISPHDLRHTFGHRWLTGDNSSGKRGDIETLSYVLGHSSIAVTQKHYAHLLESDIEKRVREIMEPVKAAS